MKYNFRNASFDGKCQKSTKIYKTYCMKMMSIQHLVFAAFDVVEFIDMVSCCLTSL